MRRLASRLLTLCSAVSLVLCVAVVGLWAWSYVSEIDIYSDFPPAHANGMYTSVDSERGVIAVYRQPWVHMAQMTSPTPQPKRVLGFAFTNARWNVNNWAAFYGGPRPPLWMPYLHLEVPYWPLALLTATLPALWARRVLRRRQQSQSRALALCPLCGYDLRASPERCPECGAADAV